VNDKAATLRALHVPGRPLVLANVWDAASARLAVEAGFPVVATSSVAVAESLGYRDHQDAPVTEMLAAAARIARGSTYRSPSTPRRATGCRPASWWTDYWPPARSAAIWRTPITLPEP
jgi:hypothetical protein